MLPFSSSSSSSLDEDPDSKLRNGCDAVSVAARSDDNRLECYPGIGVFEGGNRQRGLGQG